MEGQRRTDGGREVVHERVHVRTLEVVAREIILGEIDDAHTALDGMARVEAAVRCERLEGDGLELRLGICERRRLDEALPACEVDRASRAQRHRGRRRRPEVRFVVRAYARPERGAPERLLARRLLELDLGRHRAREEDYEREGRGYQASDASEEGEELGCEPMLQMLV